MTDIDQIALDTVEAIANIDPDKLKGGRVQALAQAQCLVRDALRELEEVGAENYTLMQELDDSLEQRDALSAHVERLHNALGPKVLDWIDCGMAANNRHKEAWARELRNELHQALAEKPETSLARLKARWQAEVLYEFTHGSYVMPATLNLAMRKRADDLYRQAKGGE